MVCAAALLSTFCSSSTEQTRHVNDFLKSIRVRAQAAKLIDERLWRTCLSVDVDLFSSLLFARICQFNNFKPDTCSTSVMLLINFSLSLALVRRCRSFFLPFDDRLRLETTRSMGRDLNGENNVVHLPWTRASSLTQTGGDCCQ